MRGQAQIIVRGEVDDLFAVEGADGCLFVFEHAQAEVRALGLEIVQLAGEIRKRIGAGGRGCHLIPPRMQAADRSGTEQISKGVSLILERDQGNPRILGRALLGPDARPHMVCEGVTRGPAQQGSPGYSNWGLANLVGRRRLWRRPRRGGAKDGSPTRWRYPKIWR